MIPNIINNLLGNETEILETARVSDETTGGTFGENFSLHVIPIEGKKNLFMNRISYNTQTNAYYENGILSHKYLKKWGMGTENWDNIELKIEYDWKTIYLARMPNYERMNDDGEISWKFNYRIGNYIINSLNLRLSYNIYDDFANVQWFIKPLSSIKNPNPIWQLIHFDPSEHNVNEIKDVTQFVKDEYGFILKAHLSGGEESEIQWQKAQLFRQKWSILSRNLIVESNDTFGLDVKVELKPDIIVDPPQFYDDLDESTSDFVIHYEFSSDDNQNTSEFKDFHVHSKILNEHFKELLESKMIDSQDKTLTLTDADISYKSLEIIHKYIYTGTLPIIDDYDEWVTLLRYASRFLIPTLIQRCEKALKDYLNHDNLNEIENIAEECDAKQLLQCCRSFELPVDDYD
ncbi:hypothetical protein C1645_828187 [Glomus cerebriforme]|uniref:BTB domain-containing protein n=1 Tax=Glomus cerebriforme TaxID=658196 RepID=A0A397SWP2_9GLOM|nr:hypothetical protein C1645_828187 [Glomus cerebriforme]